MGNAEFGCAIPDSDNYEDEINHIEIPHGRTRRGNDALTGEEQTITRSGLGKLMRVARIARPGAICDASAAAQTFSSGKMIDILEEKKIFQKMKKIKIPRKKVRVRLIICLAFQNFTGKTIGCQQSAPFKENKQSGPSKTHFTVAICYF